MHHRYTLENFDFCICFLVNLCYGVYIPVEETAEMPPPPAGSSLRHWPPGTNSLTVRAVFFCSGVDPIMLPESGNGGWLSILAPLGLKCSRGFYDEQLDEAPLGSH